MKLYLGVDGGNSKTVALVGDPNGDILGHGRNGNGDIYGAESPGSAVSAVLAAVRDALASASATANDIAAAAFRLAGVDWPEDEEFWTAELAGRLPGLGAISIANDGFAPIRCIEPSGMGVGIVSGTGPAVAARGPDGRSWSVSFWIQDGLGAGALADQALRAVFRGHLGLGPATTLTERLLTLFEQPGVEAMLHSFTARDCGERRRGMARAAPLVNAAAADDDIVALDIVRSQAEHLADYAWAAARRVGFDTDSDEIPVALAGSVLSGPTSPSADAVLAAVARRLPKSRPCVAPLPPVAGALCDALAEAGRPISGQVLARLASRQRIWG